MDTTGDEFLLLLGTKIDTDGIKNQLNNLKGLSVNVDNITINNSTLNNLKNTLKNNNLSLNLDFGNTNNVQKNIQNLSKSVTKQFNVALDSNTEKIEQFKKSLRNMNLNDTFIDSVADKIGKLGVQIKTVSEELTTLTKKNKGQDILSVDVNGIDKFGNAVTTTMKLDAETGELIKTIDQVTSATEKASKSSGNFINKQKQAVSAFRNTLNQVTSNVANSSKPIKQEDNISKLNKQIGSVNTALDSLSKANSSTFADAKIKVNDEISALKILIKELQNAEYAATSLRVKDIGTIQTDELNKLDTFISKMEQAGLYTGELKQKADKLKASLGTIGDSKGLTDYLNQFSNLESEFTKVRTTKNTNEKSLEFTKGIESEQNLLLSYQKDLEKSGVMTDEIRSKIENLINALKSVNSQSGLKVWRTDLNNAKNDISELVDATRRLSSWQDTIDTKAYDVKFAQLTSGFQKTDSFTPDIANTIESAKQTYSDFVTHVNNGEMDKATAKQAVLDKQIKTLQADLTIAKINADKLNQSMDDFSRAKLSNKIQTWLDTNTAATKEARTQMKMYLDEINRGITIGRGKEIAAEIDNKTNEMRSRGKLGGSIFDTFQKGAQKFTEWGIASGAVMQAIQTVKDMYQAVKDIDTAMTNLYKVTDETDKKYQSFLQNSVKNAKDLGNTVSNLVEQSANWAKLGYSLDESQELSKVSSIYANVGEVDNNTAVSDIVTVMKAYKMDSTQAIDIVDRLNELGNTYATDAKSLGEGINNMASTMALSNVNLDKALAILTGGTEITQNAGELGNAIKVAVLRMRGQKGELEELGEDVSDIETVSKMQTQILNLTKGAVNIMDSADPTSFRDYYDVMADIAEILPQLEETDQASLIELLFGKQRANQGQAILQAFQSGQIQKALETSMNSSGSAMKEQERWMESIEAKTQQFEASFQSLSNSLLNSDLIKWFVDFGSVAISTLEKIINLTEQIPGLNLFADGGITSISAIAGAILGAKGVGYGNTYISTNVYGGSRKSLLHGLKAYGKTGMYLYCNRNINRWFKKNVLLIWLCVAA